MATADTTTILSPDPLQETFKPYKDDQSFLRQTEDSFEHQVSYSEMVNTSSGHATLATSPTSTLSSSSSMQTSRLSLPSLWKCNNISSGHSSTSIDSPSHLSSSASSLWSHPLGDHNPAYTSTYDSDQEKNGLESLQQQQRQSLDPLPQGRYRLASINHTAPPFLDHSYRQTTKQQWQQHESENTVYGQRDLKDKPTNSCVDWMASSNYTTSCHPLRNIWTTSSVEQQPSHQRRMSLSSDRLFEGPSESETHYRNLDQVYSYGRRHSLAGPLMNKSPTHLNNQPYPGIAKGGYAMNAIGELDTSTYNNAEYSRQQQHVLNKRILDHIDEYFGGSHGKGERNNDQGDHSAPLCTGATPYSLGNIIQQHDISTPSTAMGSYSNNMGKTMTAGGDAAYFGSSTALMGKGIPLHHFLNSSTMLYNVEFKAGRTDICYIMQGDNVFPKIGDLVIVEADRGHDLGKVIAILTANDIMRNQQHRGSMTTSNTDDDDDDDELPEMLPSLPTPPLPANDKKDELETGTQKWYAKRLYRLADAEEKMSLATKQWDEEKALTVCQAKIQQKELPMQVVNAEYQWDRRKLTFYFLAEQRIDFRELVRELFKNYKTRIWMCALKSNSNGVSSANE